MSKSTRNEIINIAKKYVGAKQGSKLHRDLVDTFNKIKPNKEVANTSSPWCAITVSAVFIKAGYTTKEMAMSYNCGTMIRLAIKKNIWQEDDNYKPKKGDVIIYYWDDTGKGDCKAGASHAGIVERVSGNKIRVIEGNKGTTATCGRRDIIRNQRYIRGYITPKFKEEG